MDYTQILLAVIATVGTILVGFGPAVLRYRAGIRQARRQLEVYHRELTFQADALNFGVDPESWDLLNREIEDLLTNSEIDRFLILRAYNGVLSPRRTTAVFQWRLPGQRPVPYVHWPLDNDYIDRLRRISTERHILFKVDDLPPSAIKDVYQAEQVTAAAWWHIGTARPEPDAETAAIFYCSFCTHSEEAEITPAALTTARRIVGILSDCFLRTAPSPVLSDRASQDPSQKKTLTSTNRISHPLLILTSYIIATTAPLATS